MPDNWRGPMRLSMASVTLMYMLVLWSGAEPSLRSGTISERVPSRHVHESDERAALSSASTTVRGVAAQPPARRNQPSAKSILLAPDVSLAGSGAPASPAVPHEPINVSMLESDHDFYELAAVMRRASSPDALEKQRAYEADFADFPQAALGARVQDLTCDERSCIGQVTARRQEDIESLMMTAAESARYPIYTAQQVVVEDSGEAIRRFVISTDGLVNELPFDH